VYTPILILSLALSLVQAPGFAQSENVRADVFAKESRIYWDRMEYGLAYVHALDALGADPNHLEANVIAARFEILEMLGLQEWRTTLERAEGDIEAYAEGRGEAAME